MIKLALVGKNIKHSRSAEIYKKLIGSDVQYDLLDYADSSQIPSVSKLFETYQGINITSPYKLHFLNQVQLSSQARTLGAINCIIFKDNHYIGENTDYLAIIDILNRFKSSNQNVNVVILGDGVMSHITQVALTSLKMEYQIYSRKLTKQFNQLNLTTIFDQSFKSDGFRLVINTCSRDYVFKGIIDKKISFWDYNYNFPDRLLSLGKNSKQYIDGSEMLELQAKYALANWSITN